MLSTLRLAACHGTAIVLVVVSPAVAQPASASWSNPDATTEIAATFNPHSMAMHRIGIPVRGHHAALGNPGRMGAGNAAHANAAASEALAGSASPSHAD